MMMATVPLFLNDEIHFATTIMLVLTAQLCLYTLFQSSTTDIPKTAFLKNIDYWNMLVTNPVIRFKLRQRCATIDCYMK